MYVHHKWSKLNYLAKKSKRLFLRSGWSAYPYLGQGQITVFKTTFDKKFSHLKLTFDRNCLKMTVDKNRLKITVDKNRLKVAFDKTGPVCN